MCLYIFFSEFDSCLTDFNKKCLNCPNCGRLYSRTDSLSRHLRLECGKEPRFQCPFCLYRAKQKVNLKSHIARKHYNVEFPIFENDLKSTTFTDVRKF